MTLDDVEDLTPFAAAERYGSEAPIALDRDQALKWAASAIEWAHGIVEEPEEEQPPSTEPDPGHGSPAAE